MTITFHTTCSTLTGCPDWSVRERHRPEFRRCHSFRDSASSVDWDFETDAGAGSGNRCYWGLCRMHEKTHIFFSFTAHSKHFRDTCTYRCENLRGTCTRVSWSINYWILLLLNCTTAPQECTSTKTYRFDKLSFGNVPSSIEMMLLDDKYLT